MQTITISEINKAVNKAPGIAAKIAAELGIKIYKSSTANHIEKHDATRLIAHINAMSDKYPLCQISEVSRLFNKAQSTIKAHIKRLDIHTTKTSRFIYINKCDIPTLAQSLETARRRISEATPEQLEKRAKWRLNDIAKHNPRFKKVAPKPPVEIIDTVQFLYDGVVKTGIVIGGLDRHGSRTAMVRIFHNGFHLIQEPRYAEILNKTPDEMAEIVTRAKIKRQD